MKRVRLTEKDLLRIVKETITNESNTYNGETERFGGLRSTPTKEIENYMFFSNLKQMRRQIDIMLNEFDHNTVNSILKNGHDWADDHVSEAKVNIDQVFDFLMNELEDDGHNNNMMK